MITLVNDAWQVRDVSLAEKAVLVRLADRADGQGVCYPGLTSLSEDLGVQTRTVSRAIGTLVEKGHISIVREATWKDSRRYKVHPNPPAKNAPPAPNAPPATDEGGTCVQRTPGPATNAPGDLYQTHPNHHITTKEPPVTTTGGDPELFRISEPRPTPPRLKKDWGQGFNEFWRLYPKKVGKKAAEYDWKRLKLSPEDQLRILADVARRSLSADWIKDGGKFIPYPSSYLNGRRWEDEGVKIPGALGSTGVADRASLEAEQRRILSLLPGARTRSDEAQLKRIGQALNGVTTP